MTIKVPDSTTSNADLRDIVAALVIAHNMEHAPVLEQIVPPKPEDLNRMTVQRAVVPEWSNAARPADEEIPVGTVDEYWGPDSPIVRVKEPRGWMTYKREELDASVRPIAEEAAADTGE